MADKTTITSCSVWAKGNKKMRLVANYEKGEKPKTFYCIGHNPFPCFTMKSTYHIVNEWLKANGWEQQTGGFFVTNTRSEYTEFGERIIDSQTVVTRYVAR